jgi:hypothetical protein
MISPGREKFSQGREGGILRSCFIGAVLPLVLAVSGFASQGLTDDQATILKSARESALQYTQKLPDFICVQITRRETSAALSTGSPLAGVTGVSMGGGPAPLPDSNTGHAGNSNDVIEERVTFFHEKESYEVISLNGKKATGMQHMEVGGAVSIGEFGSALYDIFDDRSHAVFTWDRMEKVRGRRAYVFRFHVPKESGMIVIYKDTDRQIVAAYAGKIYIDESSMGVLRLSLSAELPSDFPVHSSDRTVDYEPTAIAGKSYLLPFRSEVRMTDDKRLYVNTIQFKNYQKFAVESTIHYDNKESH